MKVYKIKNKETGLYKSSGDRWTKKGKAYTEVGHVTIAIKAVTPTILHSLFWKRFYNSAESKEHPYQYHYWHHSNLPPYWQDVYNQIYKLDWSDLAQEMPELVIEMYDFGGTKEITLEQWI